MPEKWTIGETVARQIGESACWQVALIRPDGNTVNHVMPTTILEWRAAEYGIDPADVDALVDVILHEPHIPMIDDGTRGPRYADDGPDLWTAENTTTAREAHLARIQTCPVRIDVKGVKALDPIRTGHQPDPDRIRAMREAVDTNRWIKKHGDLPKQPIPQNPATTKEAARA